MSSSSSSSSSGVGFLGALFLLFLGLKLCHVIDWSWWFITMPLWGGFAILIAIVAVAFPVYLIKERNKRAHRESLDRLHRRLR